MPNRRYAIPLFSINGEGLKVNQYVPNKANSTGSKTTIDIIAGVAANVNVAN
ncbi:MAG: hypothetical protein SCALA702_28350 [Melioribacteraceae bacterium]|nr:MAG: hypothetical protein SCALA702_28350 [Melioribacteraceae bacterium]